MNHQNAKIGPDSGAGYEPSQGLSSGRLARLAWLPVPLLLATIIIARAAGLSESYMSEPLRLVLSFTFYTLVSLGTLFLIGRSFLASGKPGLLFLECGVILWSLAGTVGDAVAPNDANVNATIFNTVIFLAGLSHLAGAVLSLRPRRALRSPSLWLVGASALALVSLWLVAHAALLRWLPVFFIPGHGGTLVRYCVLISAIAAFVLSACLMLAGQRDSRAPFTTWYALAMLSLSVGLFGIMIQLSFGSVVNWLARTAQWLGGLYLLFAAVAAQREWNLPLFPPEKKSLPARYGYGVAIAIVITATAVRFALSPALGMSSPFLTFYPAVILATLYGGLRAGLLTAVLSAFIVDYFWMTPVGQFAIENPTDWLTVLLFLLACTMISFAIEAMHKARVGLVLHQEHLEELVKNRTGELEQEVAERRQAEEALRKSEARWNSAIEFLREGVIIATETGEVIYWNPAAQMMHGFTRPGEGIGPLKETPNTFDLIIPNTDRVLPLEEWPMPRIMRGESVRNFELRLRRPDQGWERIVSYSGAMVETASGERLVFLSVYDLTERKQAEEALQKARDDLEQRVIERTEQLAHSEEEFRSLAEAMPQIVWITRADGWNIYFNQQWVDYTGLTLEESYGHGWNKPFHPDDQQRAWDAWQNAVTNKGTYSLECRLRAADGTYRWWLVRGVPVVNEKGETTKWFGTCTDIDEFKRVEGQLRQAQKMEALGTLTGGVAHDFNNILAAIIGFTELVEGHVPKESREAHHLKRVMESSLRGRDLVRQMLTYARKTEQEKKPSRLSTIVKETVKLIRATTPATIALKVDTLRESGVILADPTQMQQVVMNLCTNATQAMYEKGGTLDIQVNNHHVSPSNGDPHGINPGLYTKLTVRDTGTGMSPDIIDKIFDPFFTTKKLGEGTGLGLSVVHGIVKQSNGHITVESKPGQGSTFTLYFPQITGELEADATTDDMLPTGSEHVLFIDDEEMLVEMGEDILAELGYDVTSRTSSTEALALFRLDPSRFDLVITDQTMPEMTGVELAKEILALRTDMPIIMCTGFSYVVDADKAQAAGIKAFAMKPLTKREIAIRKVLDQ